MKIVKNKDKRATIKVPPNSRVPIHTSDTCFSHHNVLVALGKRQSGKSVIICNYLRILKQEKRADRIIIISPTAGSNFALLDSLGVDEEEDIFDPDDPEVINKVKAQIEMERDEYVEGLEKLERWNELQKKLRSKTHIYDIEDELFLMFSDEYGEIHKPEMKYEGRRPVIHIFLDDCQSSKVFRDKKLMNMTIRHRHIGIMPYDPSKPEYCGAIGCSMYFAIQNYSAQAGGCPRCIRNNCTQLIVFKVKDEKELKQVYDSVAGEIPYDQFIQGYTYATDKPFGSFLIDLHPKQEHMRFRSGLDEFIVMENQK